MKNPANILITFSMLIWCGCAGSSEEKIFRSHTVEIRAMQFQPAELSVNRGDTVVFINNDILVHDVTEENSRKWTSSPLPAGASFKLIAEESTGYFCTLHPVMKGKLVIKE